ncbi:MAG TPA: aminotransferase class V-fold PLP-dependent enzyme [Bryobacteraceae bacterium]|nr:aminotransferase class V-fold PLP-dependent enzyme [Bryobacteraceae bacterium]
MNRREFLAGAGGIAAAAAGASAAAPDFAEVRKNFPRAVKETYFNAAAQHPLGLHAVRAMEGYMDFMCNGWTGGLRDFWEEGFPQIKPMFARLIHAKPAEIAFTGSTTIGENTLVNGMDLRGGNVVTNDLHYSTSISDYLTRQKLQGLEVRIVRNRDWTIDPADMERAVDRKTRLIAVSLVSSVNGHLEDIRKLADLAHAHGAYLYADIIQGCGAIPIDVKAMGIDMASCAMYKWLMGEHGFGFLYVREDLIGAAVKGTMFEGHPELNYSPWVKEPAPGKPDIGNHPTSGIGTLECGTPSVITYAAQHASLKYIESIGIPNIRSHARPLVERLRKELPPLGYTCITPAGTETSIVTFISHDIDATRRKIQQANATGKAKISITGPNSALTVGRFGNHVRFSVSVYNNDHDVDKVLEVLS